MQGSPGNIISVLIEILWAVCFLVPSKIHYPHNDPGFCADAEAVDQVERREQINQLLTGDHSAYARLFRTLNSFAANGKTIISGESRRDTAVHILDNFADKEDSRTDKLTHDEAFPTDPNTTTRFARTLSSIRRRDDPGSSQKRKVECRNHFQSEPWRPLAENINSLCTSGSLSRKVDRKERHLRSVEHEEEKQQHQQNQQVMQSHQQIRQQRQQESSPERHRQKQQRPRLLSRAERPLPEENIRSHKPASNKNETGSRYEEVFMSGAREKDPASRSGRSVSFVTEEGLKLQAVSELSEFLVKERAVEVVLENAWKLIEESWKRVELLYNNATAFSASGFRVYQRKNARTVIQAVLPFWKVDLLGALHDMTKAAAWRAFGVAAGPAARPLQFKTGKDGNDTLVEIGYGPSWQRNTYVFGWNGTQIVYSTGVDPTEAWPLERIGGNATMTPSSHLMEVTSSNGGGKAFHDLSSRFYGNEINVGDVEVGVRHQFYNDTYNATPSNIVVRAQNYSVDIAADPTDTSYRVGLGTDETKIAVLRDFDERRTAFRGDFMDWVVSWNSDSRDAYSSTISADALVGSKNEEPFLTAHMRRGEDAGYAEGDTQIQMRDVGMRMQWKDEGITGDVTLGTIKYKFDMKEGLPDFTLTAS